MHLQINDLAHPVAVDGAPEVIDVLGAITRGWTIRPGAATAEPAIRVARRRGRYSVSAGSRQDACRHATAVGAACSLVVDLIEATADARPDMLCLHAGAVRIGPAQEDSGLVVFPSRRRAGKSTLIARLASRGAEVFADDVLPLAASHGSLVARAFGVASRLRLPLPTTLPADFHRWAADHAGPSDAWYRYIAPAPGRLAALGTEAPIKAFVFLDRGPDDAAASLHKAGTGVALEALLLQNFGVAASASEILDRLAGLTTTAGVFVLRYGALDPAADLLLATFAGTGLPAAGPEVSLPLPPREAHQARDVTALAGSFRQAPGLVARTLHGRPFIGDDANGAVFALDGIGGAIWALLEEPTTPDEIEAVLAEAFPAIPPTVIRADVAAFLADLSARRLAIHHPPETTP
jgi:hypothetical protein